jgi:hypothetical protein
MSQNQEGRFSLYENVFSILPDGNTLHYSQREAGYVSRQLDPGGRIIMSTNVNATATSLAEEMKRFWDKIASWWSPVKQETATPATELPAGAENVPGKTVDEKIKTLEEQEKTGPISAEFQSIKNRLLRIRKTDQIMTQAMQEAGIQSGWTVGNLERGRYSTVDEETGERQVYDENSLTISIIGVPMEVVQRIADLILEKFNQKEVLIQDNGANKFYLWHRGNKPFEYEPKRGPRDYGYGGAWGGSENG